MNTFDLKATNDLAHKHFDNLSPVEISSEIDRYMKKEKSYQQLI